MSDEWWIVLAAAGVVGSFLAGLLGIGGGVVYVTVLAWLFDRQGWDGFAHEMPKFIIANSMAVILLSTAYGFAVLKRRADGVERRWWIAALGGVVGTMASTLFVMHSGVYRKKEYAVLFLAVMAAYLVFSLLRRGNGEAVPSRPLPGAVLAGVGTAGGLLSGLLGVGGGVIMVPLLMMWMGEGATARAARLSLTTIPWMALTAVGLYSLVPARPPMLTAGQWKFFLGPVVAVLAGGAIVGMPLGLRVGALFPAKRFKAVFLLVILASAAKIFFT